MPRSKKENNKEKKVKRRGGKKKTNDTPQINLDKMTISELRDLVMVQNYKLTVARAQIEALVEILKKNKLTTYEEFWKLTKKYLDEMVL